MNHANPLDILHSSLLAGDYGLIQCDGHSPEVVAVKKALAIQGHLVAMFAADDAYGCGFYSDETWLNHYDELRRLAGITERK